MQAAILSGKTIQYGQKNVVQVCNLCWDQPELSRHGNYLAVNANILERQLCHISVITIEHTVFLPLIQ